MQHYPMKAYCSERVAPVHCQSPVEFVNPILSRQVIGETRRWAYNYRASTSEDGVFVPTYPTVTESKELYFLKGGELSLLSLLCGCLSARSYLRDTGGFAPGGPVLVQYSIGTVLYTVPLRRSAATVRVSSELPDYRSTGR